MRVEVRPRVTHASERSEKRHRIALHITNCSHFKFCRLQTNLDCDALERAFALLVCSTLWVELRPGTPNRRFRHHCISELVISTRGIRILLPDFPLSSAVSQLGLCLVGCQPEERYNAKWVLIKIREGNWRFYGFFKKKIEIGEFS